MAINSQTRTISKAFPISFSTIAQVLILLIVGFVATWLHYRLRIPMRMPGRHGLEFMLLLMGARYLSNLRLASSVTITGSILTTLIPGFGFTDPVLPYIYLVMGVLIDFVWYVWNNRIRWIPVIAILGGFAYALIPVFRIIISQFAGYYYGSLATGIFFPIITHFAFGYVGSLVGLGVASSIRKMKK